jgi:hypothetical protein
LHELGHLTPVPVILRAVPILCRRDRCRQPRRSAEHRGFQDLEERSWVNVSGVRGALDEMIIAH